MANPWRCRIPLPVRVLRSVVGPLSAYVLRSSDYEVFR